MVSGVAHELNNPLGVVLGHAQLASERTDDEMPSQHLVGTVSDDGNGISSENLSKVFEPFFTTKPVGKGTGLCLSLCYGIIKQHGGDITVQSPNDRGTVFTVEIPIREASGPDQPLSLRDAFHVVSDCRNLVVEKMSLRCKPC